MSWSSSPNSCSYMYTTVHTHLLSPTTVQCTLYRFSQPPLALQQPPPPLKSIWWLGYKHFKSIRFCLNRSHWIGQTSTQWGGIPGSAWETRALTWPTHTSKTHRLLVMGPDLAHTLARLTGCWSWALTWPTHTLARLTGCWSWTLTWPTHTSKTHMLLVMGPDLAHTH